MLNNKIANTDTHRVTATATAANGRIVVVIVAIEPC